MLSRCVFLLQMKRHHPPRLDGEKIILLFDIPASGRYKRRRLCRVLSEETHLSDCWLPAMSWLVNTPPVLTLNTQTVRKNVHIHGSFCSDPCRLGLFLWGAYSPESLCFYFIFFRSACFFGLGWHLNHGCSCRRGPAPRPAVPCYTLLCSAMPCYALLCSATPCYAL